MHTLHVPDATGDLVIEWNPADRESTTRAREEWDRLKSCGYAFFAAGKPDAPVPSLIAARRRGVTRLDVRHVQVREFAPRRPRTVAVAPHRGG